MKYINADKLKDGIINKIPVITKYNVLNIIDELSEEREDGNQIITDDIDIDDNTLKVILGGNGDYYVQIWFTDLDGLKQYKSVRIAMSGGYSTQEVRLAIAKLYEAVNKTETQQPNPLKVAIKGDGTEEYGRKIIEYLENIIDHSEGYHGNDFADNDYYYISNCNHISWGKDIPKGYTEISLKEEEKPIYPNSIENYILDSFSYYIKNHLHKGIESLTNDKSLLDYTYSTMSKDDLINMNKELVKNNTSLEESLSKYRNQNSNIDKKTFRSWLIGYFSEKVNMSTHEIRKNIEKADEIIEFLDKHNLFNPNLK